MTIERYIHENVVFHRASKSGRKIHRETLRRDALTGTANLPIPNQHSHQINVGDKLSVESDIA
jgi:hypothetical protein